MCLGAEEKEEWRLCHFLADEVIYLAHIKSILEAEMGDSASAKLFIAGSPLSNSKETPISPNSGS